MQNPFFRATVHGSNAKVDINLNTVAQFGEIEGAGTQIIFVDGRIISINESAQTVRGRTRSAWPDTSKDMA